MTKSNMIISCKKVGAFVLGAWLVILLYILINDALKSKDLRQDDGRNNIAEKHIKHVVKKYPQGREVVHVCMTSDENTVMGLVTTMNSVWQSTRHPVVFHLVVNEEAEQILSPWLEKSSLNVIDYEIAVFDDSELEGKVKVHAGRKELAKPMNYARYFYAEIFPDLHGKIIHLDDDIVVQGDIKDLFHTEIKTDHLAAVAEDCASISKRFSHIPNVYSSYINFGHPAIHALKMSASACSFSTGVIVFDVDRWRSYNMSRKLMRWVELNSKENLYGNAKGGGGSQPPLMIELYKKYAVIDPMWHVRHLGLTASQRYSNHFINHAKLLHWNGHFKPWLGAAQFTQLWDKYYVPDPQGKVHPTRKLKKSLLRKIAE